jgi:hypothetical protein
MQVMEDGSLMGGEADVSGLTRKDSDFLMFGLSEILQYYPERL